MSDSFVWMRGLVFPRGLISCFPWSRYLRWTSLQMNSVTMPSSRQFDSLQQKRYGKGLYSLNQEKKRNRKKMFTEWSPHCSQVLPRREQGFLEWWKRSIFVLSLLEFFLFREIQYWEKTFFQENNDSVKKWSKILTIKKMERKSMASWSELINYSIWENKSNIL